MAKATKLAAVNTIISNIGQAPVTTLQSGNPLVEMAEQILDEITRSVQAEGWVFNTERSFPFTPNPSKEITIPDNVLSLDTNPYSQIKATIRSGKLYDRVAHTYTFEGIQKLDVVWLLDFEDIPEAFKNYITIRAANVFAGRSVGSVEAVRFGEREEIMARAGALEYDTQQGDYNVFSDSEEVVPFLNYRPVNPLYRY
jgi:hypothetical protein